VQNSPPQLPKTFPEQRPAVTRNDFRRRLALALRRRLYPNTGLTRLALAHSLGKDEGTIDNWLNEYSQPDSYLMGELITFFDAAFANEVYGAHGVVVAKLSDARRASALRKVNSIAHALPALEEMLAEGVA
jgi:hypothetical protein